MSVNTPAHALRDDTANGAFTGAPVRPFTETKPALKTTEFVGLAKAGSRAHRDA